jgi:hypothetical protein
VLQAGLPPEDDLPSTSQGVAGTSLHLTAEEEAELFEDDDDDDEDDDLDLDELENQVRQTL